MVHSDSRNDQTFLNEVALNESLLDAIPDIIFYKDIHGVYLGCNQPFCEFVGRSKVEIVGKTDHDLFDKGVADLFRQYDLQVLDSDNAHRNKVWITYPDGRKKFVENHKAPYKDSNGNLIGILGINRDITESEQAAKAIEENEANFRSFFESITDLIFVSDEQGQIFFSNSAVTNHLGYTAEELKTMHVLDVHPKIYRDEAEEIFGAMFRGDLATCPLPLARKDGTFLPVETRVWFGQWGNRKCIFGLSKDLTKEQEAQQRFERLFRHNPALMAVSSLPEKTFIDVNEAFLKTLGYSREEIIGVTTTDLDLFPNRKEQEALADLLQTQGSFSGFELKVRRKDGELIDGLFSGEIISSQGKMFFLTVMIDITDRKQAELLLAKQKEELSELNATKDKFFSIIAHDLRSPFNAIIGFSNLLLEQVSKKDYVGIGEYAEIIQKSSLRAMHLLTNLMEWTKSQTGRMDFNPNYFEVVSLINEIAELKNDSAKQKTINLTCSLPLHATVFGDKAMIETILRNLLSNAVKFTKPGGQILLSARRVQEGLFISISDTGIGISKERLGNLFKIDKGRSTPGTGNEHGSGLGLILCKDFIERHGSKIIVETEPGKGSTFSFLLPNDPN
jgi:PAS domain S-box-containing protein